MLGAFEHRDSDDGFVTGCSILRVCLITIATNNYRHAWKVDVLKLIPIDCGAMSHLIITISKGVHRLIWARNSTSSHLVAGMVS